MGPIRRFFDDFYYVRYELAVLSVLLATALGLFALSYWEDQRRIEPALQRAEACSEESPEEFRAMLDSLSPRFWWYPERRARYALLYSKALDKTLVDLKSDSLIITAVNYYAATDHPRYRMLAFYYAGRVAQNSQHTARAYAYFSFADSLAVTLGEHHIGGLSARALAEICNQSNRFTEELFYTRQAVERFTAAGSEIHADWARYDLAHAQANSRLYHEAIENYDHFAQSSARRGDTLALSHCLTDKAASHLALGDSKSAKELLERAQQRYHHPASTKWLADYAYACALTGDLGRASRYIAQAEERVKNPDQRMRVLGRKSQIEALRGAYKSAYDLQEQLNQAIDSTIRITLEESIAGEHRDYYKKESRKLSLQLETQRRNMTRTILLLALFSLIAVGWLTRQSRQRKAQIEDYLERIREYMGQIENFREQLQDKEASMAGIDQQLNLHLGTINRMAETYYTHRESPREQKKIYNSILNNLQEFASVEHTQQHLEPLIDRAHNNIIQRMRAQLPSLSDSELQLACFLIIGFSSMTISLFQQTPIENVYRRVYRLREKVKKSEAADREEICVKLKINN